LIVLCGVVEVIVLFFLKAQTDGSDSITLAALTISVSAILSVLLIFLTNRQANKFGKLYFTFLCVNFLKTPYAKKINYGADKIISNLVVDPIKVYRNVFSSFFMCIFAAVYFVSGFLGSLMYLGFSGVLLPVLVVVSYLVLLTLSKTTMKAMGVAEYTIQNSMIQSLNLYSSNIKGFYSYKIHSLVFLKYIEMQSRLLDNIFKQNIINQIPKSLITVLVLALISIYFMVTGKTDLQLSSDQVIGVMLLLKTAGPAQLLFSTANNVVYFSHVVKPLLSDMRFILSNPDVVNFDIDQESHGSSKEFEKILQVKSGGVLIHGPSGSGKSIFLDNLAGVYDGHIYNAQVVTSSNTIFDDTLLNNVVLWDVDVNFQRLRVICDILELDLDLNENYGWGDSVRLSNGQVQRVMIARGLYNWKHTLILDEATYSFPISIKNKLFRYLATQKDKLWIVVSHQEETSFYFDKIIDFEQFKGD
jgi:ABC-type lipoprotein export system ATPase subunit